MDKDLDWKRVGHWDENGFNFGKEMLCGDLSNGINFDTVRKHKELGYLIFEFLLCDESQTVCPFTSHPNRYWNKNKFKFINLFQIAKDLKATLYLINYSKKGTANEDKILGIKVLEVSKLEGIIKQQVKKFTRKEFSDWFREINKKSMNL